MVCDATGGGVIVYAVSMTLPSPHASPNDPLLGHPGSRLPSTEDVAALMPPADIDPRADVGHVNLAVSDLERSVRFYRDLLGLHITQRDEQSAFLACGTYHHHVHHAPSRRALMVSGLGLPF